MPTTASKTPLTVLRVLLTVGIAESFVHYLDNTLRYSDYTGPNPPAVTSWIAQWMIPVSWVLFTAVGLLGYRRFRQGRLSEAAANYQRVLKNTEARNGSQDTEVATCLGNQIGRAHV